MEDENKPKRKRIWLCLFRKENEPRHELGQIADTNQEESKLGQSKETIQEENELGRITETNQEEKEPTQSTETNQEDNEPTQSTDTNQEKNEPTQSTETNQEKLVETFLDLGAEDSFSGNAEPPQLTVAECLLFPSAELVKSPAQRQKPGKLPAELSILTPCCMNPRLSEQLYDAGFLNITNVDSSTETITNMFETKGRGRPEMKWRVMNFTAMQFPNEEFDAVVDKRLDALMESKGGKKMANIYLYEVKRILKGKYICITSAGSHVLDLLLPKFRFGWEMSLHTIAQDQEPNLQTFVVVADKSDPNIVYSISLNLGACHSDQADEVITAVEKENNIRGAYSQGRRNTQYTLEDLKLGARGNISEYEPGRRINLILGEFGLSRGKKSFIYNCVLLDAKQGSACFVHHYALYVVPQLRARDEDCTSKEGQWRIVESLKAARLLMVFLDSSNSIYSMRDIHYDLAPYMKQLAPGYVDCGHTYIRFQAASEGINDQEILHQVGLGDSHLLGAKDSFSWIEEQLPLTVADCLLFPSAELVKSPAQRQNPGKLPVELSILAPCCMNPSLSEKLYDTGFLNITNVDSSTETITNMLETKGIGRPEMKWRVMNFTAMQFPDKEFDAVVDKRLDALMESMGGKIMANIYLYEVKRILKGKYICITSAGSHVLDLLFPKFRFGWEMSLHTIARDQEPNLQTFVVVAEKSDPNIVYSISLNLGACHGDQADEVITAVEKENNIRGAYSKGRRNIRYTLEDLKLGAEGNISEYEPGRRINLILGEFGLSRGKKSFIYNCVLLDAKQGSGCLVHHYALYVVPQLRARDEDCTSKEGQWRIVESLKAARLLMVFLDSSNSIYSMRDIHDDLAPYMKQLAPGYVDCGHTYSRFQVASDGIKDQEILHQVGLGDCHLLDDEEF